MNDDDEGRAIARVCDAVRIFVHQRYQGEIRARGYQFMVAVFGELLSMCVGIELANCQDPDTVEARLEQLAGDMAPRVLHYLQVIEQVQQQQAEADPGDAAPSIPSRLM